MNTRLFNTHFRGHSARFHQPSSLAKAHSKPSSQVHQSSLIPRGANCSKLKNPNCESDMPGFQNKSNTPNLQTARAFSTRLPPKLLQTYKTDAFHSTSTKSEHPDFNKAVSTRLPLGSQKGFGWFVYFFETFCVCVFSNFKLFLYHISQLIIVYNT